MAGRKVCCPSDPGDPPHGGLQFRPPLETDLVFKLGKLRQCIRTYWGKVLLQASAEGLKPEGSELPLREGEGTHPKPCKGGKS